MLLVSRCMFVDWSGLHLVVCYHAMGDRAKQKEAFQKLLQVPFDMENEDKYKDLEVRTPE